MKLNMLCRATMLACLLAPGLLFAQKLDPAKSWEIGDKAAYKMVVGTKPVDMEEELTAITSTDYVSVQRIGSKSFEYVYGKDGVLHKGIANGEQSTFEPGLKHVDLPLEVGKKWTSEATIVGETFRNHVTHDCVVEKIEKVATPAGEFDAFKVSYTGRIQGTNNKKRAYTGKDSGSEWVVMGSDGKAYVIKSEYDNSFGTKITRELVAVSYKK